MKIITKPSPNKYLAQYIILILKSNLFPSNAMTSTGASAPKCIDGVTSGNWLTVCGTPQTPQQPAPWIALEFHSRVEVTKVVLYARKDCCSERTKNLDVRITDELPTSGDRMYTGGELLGSYEGPAREGQIITVKGSPQFGRYVLVQMNNPQPLSFHEVTVFGKGARTSCQSKAAKGKLYGGKAETTEDGFTCRNWTEKGAIAIGVMGDRNYCRQPGNIAAKVWCYISEEVNVKQFGYCAVPFCGETGDHASIVFIMILSFLRL